MDPLTQGILGSTASQLVSSRKQKVSASVLGFLSGMAADLDILIRSSNDPLFSLEFHRHFTHALIFIPFGALLCALVFNVLVKKWFSPIQLSFRQIYLFCFAGYATHALLDSCTTYGTQLLWPFSDVRIAWNNVSVVDPIFTLPLLIIMVFSIVKRSTLLAWVGTIYALSYLLLGVIQNNRAQDIAYELATSRGHEAINLGVKPSFANILVWKSVYEFDGRYYVDAVRVGLKSKIYSGSSTAKLDVAEHFPWLDQSSQQAEDIERFRWFSAGHLGLDPDSKNRIIDIRYSLVPNRLDGMWGITLDPEANNDQHIVWSNSRPEGAVLAKQTNLFWAMLLGKEI